MKSKTAKKAKAKAKAVEKKKKPGKGKPKDKGAKGEEKVSFTRVELQKLLLGIAEITPQGVGSISESQYAGIKHILDGYFGEEPSTVEAPENEGETNVQ